VRGQQSLVLQVHGFQHGGLAFVLVVEVFQGFKVIFGPQQLLAFDAQRLEISKVLLETFCTGSAARPARRGAGSSSTRRCREWL
jgi:hypothetical protein